MVFLCLYVRTAWMDTIKTWTGLPVEESVRATEDNDKCPRCGQPSDRGRLENRTDERTSNGIIHLTKTSGHGNLMKGRIATAYIA